MNKLYVRFSELFFFFNFVNLTFCLSFQTVSILFSKTLKCVQFGAEDFSHIESHQ